MDNFKTLFFNRKKMFMGGNVNLYKLSPKKSKKNYKKAI